MNQEQFAYLRARELETYFREKVNLSYKGQNSSFSEYGITHVNNRPVRQPITVGFSELSAGAHLYISTDLTKTKQGIAKIEFDLSEDTLHGLETGKHKIRLLDAIQTSVSNRFLINAEDIAGQSLLRSADREYKKTITNPFRQLWDVLRFVTGTYPDGPFGKPMGDTVTVKQSKPMHISHNANRLTKTNFGLRNNVKNPNNMQSHMPTEPIYVRSASIPNSTYLSPDVDYELSFSQDSSRGIPRRKCTFTPVDDGNHNVEPLTIEYVGIRLAEKSMALYLPSDQTITLTVSAHIGAHGHEHVDNTHDYLQEEDIDPARKYMQLPSKEKEIASLDSMIASAQSRAGTQKSRQPLQQDLAIKRGPERS